MNAEELERIAFLTRRFNQLQGLRVSVPIALLCLSANIEGLLIDRLPILALSLQASLFLCAIVLLFRAKAFYRERVDVVTARIRPAISSPRPFC